MGAVAGAWVSLLGNRREDRQNRAYEERQNRHEREREADKEWRASVERTISEMSARMAVTGERLAELTGTVRMLLDRWKPPGQ